VCLSCTVNDIFNDKFWRDLENNLVIFKMSEMVPFDRSCSSSYSRSTETMALSCIVSEIK